MPSNRLTSLLCLAVFWPGMLPGQSAATPAPAIPASTTSDPVLRVETRLVAINVIAKNGKGQPVDDLAKSDFTIRDNGAPRDIAVFSLERMTSPATAPRPAPGVLTNRIDQQARAATIILFDGLNTAVSDQSYAHQELLKFLRQMPPDQSVALYALGNSLRILHEFTADPAELLRAAKNSVQLATHTPEANNAVSGTDASTGISSVDQALSDITQRFTDYQNIDRARTTIEALNAIAQHVSRLPGRKNLVWISGGFPIFIGFPQNGTGSTGSTQSFADDIARLTKTLNDANLAVYPVDARGLIAAPPTRMHPVALPISPDSLDPDASRVLIQKIAFSPAPPGGGGTSGGVGRASPPRAPTAPVPRANTSKTAKSATQAVPPIIGFDDGYQTMALIAEKTGGLAFHNRNDLAAAIGSAVDDARVSYSLGFYVPSADLDGKYHDLKITVDRAGVKLRHRLGYEATLPAAVPAPLSLTDFIHRQLPGTDVGLTVSFQKGASGGQAARINVDTHNLTLVEKEGKWIGQAEMLVVTNQGDLSNDQGGPTLVNLKLPPAQYEKVSKEGLTLVKNLVLRPGQNDIRIALRDKPSGAVGSLYLSVTIAPAAAPAAP